MTTKIGVDMDQAWNFVDKYIDFFLLAMITGAVLFQLFNRLRSKKVAVNNSSALVLAAVLTGKPTLIGDGHTPGNNHYSVIVGLNASGSLEGGGGYALFSVELPFVSSVHLVGIARGQLPRIELDPAESSLAKMDLEGDHSDYFQVFVGNDDQIGGRYVLDPKAMVFTIDFCRQFHWEIRDDMLYFLGGMGTDSFSLVDQFIAEIKPAIDSGKPLKVGGHNLPYVTLNAARMNCPICTTELVADEEMYICPNGHGRLLDGKQMLAFREAASAQVLREASDEQPEEDSSERELQCPYCHSPMKRSRYQQTAMHIDVCTSCRYRWVDQHEMGKTLGVSAG